MIGRGMPISHSSAPFPKPIVASIHCVASERSRAAEVPREPNTPDRRAGGEQAERRKTVQSSGECGFYGGRRHDISHGALFLRRRVDDGL